MNFVQSNDVIDRNRLFANCRNIGLHRVAVVRVFLVFFERLGALERNSQADVKGALGVEEIRTGFHVKCLRHAALHRHKKIAQLFALLLGIVLEQRIHAAHQLLIVCIGRNDFLAQLDGGGPGSGPRGGFRKPKDLRGTLKKLMGYLGRYKALLVIVALLYTLLSALAALALGLKMPNLTWTNETTPIKQSGCVMLSLFANWFYALALGGLYFLCGNALSAAVYLAIFAVVTAAGSALLLHWVKQRGARIFAAL